jgi:endoglucanase
MFPTFILYYIYQRDNSGGFSAGGAQTPAAYTNFINSAVNALRAKSCIVVLEPDSLAALDGLSVADRTKRIELLSYAVNRLSTLTNAHVYADGGHPNWKDAATMSSRLKSIGVQKIRGFALNVSNFIETEKCKTYGTQIARATDFVHFVIDTSRNGRGPTPDYQWCNPPGRGLGLPPTLETGDPLFDGRLFVKYPGESDGTCNGGPSAGQWFAEYALDLCEFAVF